MLDPAACAAMAIGTPRAAMSALIDLNRLLTERGFRRSSPDDPNIVQEKQDEEPAGAVASGSAPAQHAVRFPKASWDEPDGPRDGARPTHSPASCWRPPASRRGSMTMTSADLLPAAVLKRKAVVYVRQPTQAQVQSNLESQRRQYSSSTSRGGAASATSR
jgi:hypothetical protein